MAETVHLDTGDVVTLFGVFAVFAGYASGDAVLLPIKKHNMHRLRSDVVIKDQAIIAAMGISGRQFLIRCGEAMTTNQPIVRIGRAPDDVLNQIKTALRQTVETARIERRHTQGMGQDMLLPVPLR